MSVFTIELRKHTATISWRGGPIDLFGVPAGSLTVYTEDPLSDNREARDAAELNLYRLKQILNNLNGTSDYCTVIENRPDGK